MSALNPTTASSTGTGGSRLRHWAEKTWADRDQWLQTPGGVEAVFSAAQVLGCRAEALDWLSRCARHTPR